MSVLFILIPLSLVMGVGALFLFIKAAKSGEFDSVHKDWSKILEIKEKKQ
jgi:cbb3-type cytochrome oxidase maturation protein